MSKVEESDEANALRAILAARMSADVIIEDILPRMNPFTAMRLLTETTHSYDSPWAVVQKIPRVKEAVSSTTNPDGLKLWRKWLKRSNLIRFITMPKAMEPALRYIENNFDTILANALAYEESESIRAYAPQYLHDIVHANDHSNEIADMFPRHIFLWLTYIMRTIGRRIAKSRLPRDAQLTAWKRMLDVIGWQKYQTPIALLPVEQTPLGEVYFVSTVDKTLPPIRMDLDLLDEHDIYSPDTFGPDAWDSDTMGSGHHAVRTLVQRLRDQRLVAGSLYKRTGTWDGFISDGLHRDEHKFAIKGPPTLKALTLAYPRNWAGKIFINHDLTMCGACNAPATAAAPLGCSQCKSVVYCNQDCANTHWERGHQYECIAGRSSNSDDDNKKRARNDGDDVELEASDGVTIFKVTRDQARTSVTLRDLLDHTPDVERIPLPNVDKDMLENVVDIMRDDWDTATWNQTYANLVALIHALNYLDMQAAMVEAGKLLAKRPLEQPALVRQIPAGVLHRYVFPNIPDDVLLHWSRHAELSDLVNAHILQRARLTFPSAAIASNVTPDALVRAWITLASAPSQLIIQAEAMRTYGATNALLVPLKSKRNAQKQFLLRDVLEAILIKDGSLEARIRARDEKSRTVLESRSRPWSAVPYSAPRHSPPPPAAAPPGTNEYDDEMRERFGFIQPEHITALLGKDMKTIDEAARHIRTHILGLLKARDFNAVYALTTRKQFAKMMRSELSDEYEKLYQEEGNWFDYLDRRRRRDSSDSDSD